MTRTTAQALLLPLFLSLGIVLLNSHGVESFVPPAGHVVVSSTESGTHRFATPSTSEDSSTVFTPANVLIENLWGANAGGGVNIDRIVESCSRNVVWEDFRLKEPVEGRDAVSNLLRSQFPEGTSIMLDRVSDGVKSSGFTWTREYEGKLGLRGTTYVRLDDDGKIECVKELAEPLVKPGDMMLKLLQAATKNVERPEKNPTYVEETPTKCTEIVDYIWNRAYPKDAPVDESIRFFSPKIVYQDFNYPVPIVGLENVETFCRDWGDFPGIEFVINDLSEGDTGCVFTWKVKVNGEEGPQGISFYQTDGQGKIIYIRDTPAPSIRPNFGTLARILRPKLRTFRSRKDMVGGIPKETADMM